MSAYKQFNSEDVIVSPLEVNKGYRSTIVPILSSSGGYGLISYGVNEYSSSFDRIDADGERQMGVIAQEVEAVNSSLVDDSEELKRVYNKDIMFMMLK